jgi:hypothetical protein
MLILCIIVIINEFPRFVLILIEGNNGIRGLSASVDDFVYLRVKQECGGDTIHHL